MAPQVLLDLQVKMAMMDREGSLDLLDLQENQASLAIPEVKAQKEIRERLDQRVSTARMGTRVLLAKKEKKAERGLLDPRAPLENLVATESQGSMEAMVNLER